MDDLHLSRRRKRWRKLFGLADLEDFPPRYNIAPTQPILIVAAGHPREPGSNLPDRRALLVRWGFIPVLGERSEETAADDQCALRGRDRKAGVQSAMRHRRVLVPTSGFYEWKKLGPKERQPYWVRPQDGGVIAFAGVMETWHEPGGSEIDTGAILTTAANADLAPIHDRMPVVIQPQDFSRWLDCRNQEPRDVADLMQPAEPGFFEAIPVSDKVNKPPEYGAGAADAGPAPAARAGPNGQLPSKQAEKPADQLDCSERRLTPPVSGGLLASLGLRMHDQRGSDRLPGRSPGSG